MSTDKSSQDAWRELARKIIAETDGEKVLQMAQQLVDLLDEYFEKGKSRRPPNQQE